MRAIQEMQGMLGIRKIWEINGNAEKRMQGVLGMQEKRECREFRKISTLGILVHFLKLRLCALDAQIVYECQSPVDACRRVAFDTNCHGLGFYVYIRGG